MVDSNLRTLVSEFISQETKSIIPPQNMQSALVQTKEQYLKHGKYCSCKNSVVKENLKAASWTAVSDSGKLTWEIAKIGTLK